MTGWPRGRGRPWTRRSSRETCRRPGSTLSVNEILRWPGVIAESSIEPETLAHELVALMKQATADFLATREREGAKLAAMIVERCVGIRGYCAEIEPRVPMLQAAFAKKLSERIRAVETGGCPHAAIREDISANLLALEELHRKFHPEILLVESGGDNLAAHFSRELADFTVYVIDVSGGDKIPRKGGPGITQADLLVINKTDLAEAVGADLGVMDRDSRRMRGNGPFVFAQVKHGLGVEEITQHVLHAWQHVVGVPHAH